MPNSLEMNVQAQPERETLVAALGQLRGAALGTFAACFLVWTLSNLDQSLFGYAVPHILSDLHISLNTIGLMLSIGFGSAVVGAISWGIVSDRLGRRLSLFLCLSLSASFVGLQAFTGSALTLGAVRALAFAVGAGVSPIVNSYAAESVPPRIRGLMIGLLQCGYPVGWFLASIIVVPVMTQYGWRSIFMVAFAVVPIAALLYLFLPESRQFVSVRRSRVKHATWREDLVELLAGRLRRQTLFCGVVFFTQGGAYAGMAFYLPTFFHQVRGYTEAQSAHIVGLSYALGIIGYLGASLVGEFLLTRRNTIIVWSWAGAFAFLAFDWLPTTIAQDIIGFGVTAMFFYGAYAIMATYALEVFPTRLRATGAAICTAFSTAAFATYPIIVSHAVGVIGWQMAFTVTVVATLMICGFAALGLENTPSGREITDS